MTISMANTTDTKDASIKYRNSCWSNNTYIPSWVNIEKVELDQFFTQPEVAQKCYDSFIKVLKKDNVNTNDYTFVEPSAGSGSFYDLLPNNSIGLDVMPLHSKVKQQDFLSWKPKNKNKKYLFIGNPPFGYRAWTALLFMNHAAKFGDYIGFILPMAFQSDGKGSPKHRVKGMKLVHSEIIDSDSFYEPSGKKRKVNALWQIWKKGENIIPKRESCSQWVDIFTVDLRKERLCGLEKMDKANFFLQRTYYKEPPSFVKSFSEVKYTCGYGFIIKKDEEKIIKALNEIDWEVNCNLAAHNCRHISMYHIEKALTDKGFINV
ncbi:MAG: Unknown protein [uncultured Sulfurovum sp.]|uniref:SAM-dependent methyltransferase n=1 Tax=uncultured Sulfurovum sp. TaxID=269237 RepID=A0A6S6TMR5_9BACT|nr:MAG: Unknown protein [uncultured Sulfurovum sp.]